jgi:hypothetical protein
VSTCGFLCLRLRHWVSPKNCNFCNFNFE